MENDTSVYQKHMGISERTYIEEALERGDKFADMARFLGKDPTTISKEVRKHRILKRRTRHEKETDCAQKSECTRRHICFERDCDYYCGKCKRYRCDRRCSDYRPVLCQKLQKAPYVCNGCESRPSCRNNKYYYRARHAEGEYGQALHESRIGIDLSPEELDRMDKLVSPLLKQGQSIAHIYAYHGDELPCTQRTLYNYVDNGLFRARNIDLPRKVRYKPRKPSSPTHIRVPGYRDGRTYRDFEKNLEQYPDTNVVEMDTVEGRKGGKALLSMLFRNCSLMLLFLLPECTQSNVSFVFDNLSTQLGASGFRRAFPLILTDNGSEFWHRESLEHDDNGKARTRIFYCDPNASWQKGRLEKNHEFIRYVVARGKSFDLLTQPQVARIANHINSLARDSLNRRCPMEVAQLLLGEEFMSHLGLERIPADDVYLKPGLLKL